MGKKRIEKKVPITIYENEKRITVGEAVVEIKDDGAFYVSGWVSPKHATLFAAEVKHISIGSIARKETNVQEIMDQMQRNPNAT